MKLNIKTVLLLIASTSVFGKTVEEYGIDCNEEIQPFKNCLFDYENVEVRDTIGQECGVYNSEKCQGFFENPFKHAPSCAKILDDEVTLKKYSDVNQLISVDRLELLKYDVICKGYQNNNMCPLGIHFVMKKDQSMDYLKINCHYKDCNNLATKYYDYMEKTSQNKTENVEELLKYTLSEDCTSRVLFNKDSESTTSKTLELFDACNFELKNFQKCKLDSIDETNVEGTQCTIVQSEECQSFYENPFKNAPSCEEASKQEFFKDIFKVRYKDTYPLLDMDDEIKKYNSVCSSGNPTTTVVEPTSTVEPTTTAVNDAAEPTTIATTTTTTTTEVEPTTTNEPTTTATTAPTTTKNKKKKTVTVRKKKTVTKVKVVTVKH